jgi:hypothetical protein
MSNLILTNSHNLGHILLQLSTSFHFDSNAGVTVEVEAPPDGRETEETRPTNRVRIVVYESQSVRTHVASACTKRK